MKHKRLVTTTYPGKIESNCNLQKRLEMLSYKASPDDNNNKKLILVSYNHGRDLVNMTSYKL